MKTRIRRAFAFIAMLAVVSGAAAQVLRTGYFLDGNLFGHRLNPALSSDKGYFSLPFIGGVNAVTMGNVGMSSFLYDSPFDKDKQVTFMHSSISADEFLGNLERDNVMNANVDVTLLSAGFKALGGYNTIDVTLRTQAGLSLPYDMLCFMKTMGDNDYSFGGIKLYTRNYVDLSLGHSHNIGESLRVGARAKVLFGLGYANVEFSKMDVTKNGLYWEVYPNGKADIALGGSYAVADELGGRGTVDGYENASLGLNGFGAGLDLGATYDFSQLFAPGLVVSAS